jgi:hypothetical protein
MIKVVFLFISLLTGLNICGQVKTGDDPQRDLAFYDATSKWFSAWKLISKDIYGIDKVQPVEFVFFDDKYVYSTSGITIKNGSAVRGASLLNLNLTWKKSLHNDTLTLPDQSVVPVNLMSFAAEIPTEINRSFFVMPLPGYWQNKGVSSKELGLDNLVTGVFIHEFSHSQQMQNFGKTMTVYEEQTDYGVEFSDDIVQNIFGNNPAYLNLYNKEVSHLYASVSGNSLDKKALNEGLTIMRQRQTGYFKEKFKALAEIDNFFLTMEGLGQYSMYLWLTHAEGGNIKKEVAIEGVRRSKKWWSQDEGFALFLILDRLATPDKWAKEMFGNNPESVTVLINKLYR